MVKSLKNVKVVFASVTKEGGHKNGKHLLGIEITKEQKKEITKDFEALWSDNKSAKAKKPAYPVEDWFSKDEQTGAIQFWMTKKADGKPATFKIADKSMTAEMFTDFGEGSIIDVEFDLYFFKSADYGEMVSRSFNAIRLVEYKQYEGGGSTLEGESVTVGYYGKSEDKKKDKKKKAEVTESDDDGGEVVENKTVKKFKKAIDKGDLEKAATLLEDLEDHEDYKSFKKLLKKAGK